MDKYKLKSDTMPKVIFKNVCDYLIYLGDSKNSSNKGFINIDNGEMGCTRRSCF